jgi:hypothetical protein
MDCGTDTEQIEDGDLVYVVHGIYGIHKEDL